MHRITGRQADTSNFTAVSQTLTDDIQRLGADLNIGTDVLNPSSSAVSTKSLASFYRVGLWSYCEGERIDGFEKVTYCSSPNTQFWFNLVEVWGLQNTTVQRMLGDDLQIGLNAYQNVARWTNIAFVLTTILTAGECLVSLLAIFSRGGSLLAFCLSAVSEPS